MVMTILEGTIMIIVFGLILAHAKEFSQALQAAGNTYAQAVNTLSAVAG